MRYKYFLSFLITLFAVSNVKANFIFDSGCTAAYKATFELKFDEARKYIHDEKARFPQNGIPYLLDNYIDYLYLLTTENKADYNKFKDREDNRIDALKKNDKNSPYYLFTQAEVYLQWGMIKARFGDYTSSMMDVKKARSLLKDNAEKFSDFLPNQKSLALIDVIFGAIPSNLKGIAGFFGFKGDINRGYRLLEKFRAQMLNSPYSFYNDEAVFLICFTDIDVLHHTDNYTRLSVLLDSMNDGSRLKPYLQGYVAFKTGHNDDAINYLQKIARNGQANDMPIINYLLGNAKLCRMDTDAYVYFAKYINTTHSVNYIKDSYQKIAYCYLLHNDAGKYNYYANLAKIKGRADDEKDKQALKEANDSSPNTDLLKARFYFDGGYFEKAITQLKTAQSNNSLKNLRDKIELYYRFGRTYERLDRFDDALANYQTTINLGKNQSYYFAANSSLHSGIIYEQKKDYKKATQYYKLTLQMKNHEYQSSIDTQAQEGLERIK